MVHIIGLTGEKQGLNIYRDDDDDNELIIRLYFAI